MLEGIVPVTGVINRFPVVVENLDKSGRKFGKLIHGLEMFYNQEKLHDVQDIFTK